MEGYTEVFAWGGDHFGQLGLGSKHTGKTYSSPRFCSFNILIREIACGEEHSAFIASSGHVYSMGSNSDGRLGLGDKLLRQSSSPCLVEGLISHRCVKISCGWGHTGVITDEGSIFLWGVGEFGALGSGGAENSWAPVKALLPRSMRGLDISCGSRHTGLIVEENRSKVLLMTGSGEAGQLGTGKREKEFSFVVVPISEEVQEVACGVFHSLALSVTGKIYSMGGNSFGQLGLGSKKSCSRPERVTVDCLFVKVACGSHSAGISEKGQLYVWGTGVFGEYLHPTRMAVSSCKELGIGGSYGIAVDTSGNVYAWGANSNGELGLGDYDPRVTPSAIQALKGKCVKKISCGGSYVLGLGVDLVNEYKREKEREREISPVVEAEMSRASWKRTDFDDTRARNRERTHTEERFIGENKNFGESKIIGENKINGERKTMGESKINGESKLRNSSMDVERNRFKDMELEGKTKENERLNSSYKQLASRYEDVKLELARANEKCDQYRQESQRFERELGEYKRSIDYSHKELNNSNAYLKNSLEESQRQNCALSSEIKSYKDELQRYKRLAEEIKHSSKLEASQKIEDINQNLHHKYTIEINDLQLLHEQEIIKKRQLEKDLDVASKHIANVEESLNGARVEISDLNMRINQNMYNSELTKKSLQSEIEKYYKETNDLRRRVEMLSNDKERVSEMLKQEIDNISLENTELKRKLDMHSIEKEKYRLESDKYSSENVELRRKIEILTVEKEKTIKILQGQISDLGSEMDSLRDLLDRLSSEKQEMSNLLAQKGAEVKHCDQDRASLESSLTFYKQTCEDLNYQINKLQQQLSDQGHTINSFTREVMEWEESYRILLDDNSVLKATIAELESKNRQLFDNLEKELTQRAKEYKERTITMLNTPNRSTSPYLRPNTPMRHHRDKSDEMGNTAARLLETMDSPKSVRGSQYLSIPQVYKGSTTPTKDDVRIRIASLMKNRMNIEEQIQSLNQD